VPADLFVYALVAAGLVFWLRSILGTRHGEERSRPDPFAGIENISSADKSDLDKKVEHVVTQEDIIRDLAVEAKDSYSIDNKTTEEGLVDIAKADKNFDIHFFMQGAQDAFVMIVESFAEGDRDALRGLLSPAVYEAFDGAIKQREEKGHSQYTDIHAVRKAEAIDAELHGRKAYITIRFSAEESSVTKDKDGEIVAGHPDKVSVMKDIWVFSRDIKSRDPSWLLEETRDAGAEDNDLLPDSH
tara:strand:+ start:443 stop:1171 length:729 start_codon:yes stop_codon:yes gene_type:complete